MSLLEAIKSGFTGFVRWRGRSSRSAYWWFFLFAMLASVVATVVDVAVGANGAITGLVAVVLFLPALSVLVRRLHDTDRSGWWYWIGLVPFVGSIVLLVFLVSEGTAGPNRYGSASDVVETDLVP